MTVEDKHEHRLWLDRVNAHGPELLDALKQLVVAADGMHYELRREFDHAQYVIDRAEALVAKLDGVSPLKSD